MLNLEEEIFIKKGKVLFRTEEKASQQGKINLKSGKYSSTFRCRESQQGYISAPHCVDMSVITMFRPLITQQTFICLFHSEPSTCLIRN